MTRFIGSRATAVKTIYYAELKIRGCSQRFRGVPTLNMSLVSPMREVGASNPTIRSRPHGSSWLWRTVIDVPKL